ncbi:MAG: hypothetical protein H6910_00835 [Rickettsiaceae bacterium]|nr:hypothetical protein [Rickettsiaceae bacterium]
MKRFLHIPKKSINFELVNKFKTNIFLKYIYTDKGLIDIEKIYEIIAKAIKGEYTEQIPETGLTSVERAL